MNKLKINFLGSPENLVTEPNYQKLKDRKMPKNTSLLIMKLLEAIVEKMNC